MYWSAALAPRECGASPMRMGGIGGEEVTWPLTRLNRGSRWTHIGNPGVDDDASLRRSLRNLLTSWGFRVETFESAEVFLESGSLDKTSCLVLDLQMPGMGGLGLMRHLAESDTRIPVIIVTAHGDDDMRQRTLQVGAIAFLEKPVRGPALLEAIR